MDGDKQRERQALLAPLLEYIDARCAQLGISRAKVCHRAGLGEDCIRKIAEGHVPGPSRLSAIARGLDVPIEILIGLINPSGRAPRPLPAAPAVDSTRALAEPENITPSYRAQLVPVAALKDGGYLGRAPAQAGVDPATVMFRAELIIDRLHGRPSDFRWAEIAGSAMAPDLCEGDEVLIDCRVTQPIEPALFALDEGIGCTARWVEFVPGSAPPRYRVRCSDNRFAASDVAAGQIRIAGRIVWLGRRL